MTVQRVKFNPEVLLSAPRRSACVPNPSGTRIAFTQSTYSFESHTTNSELIILDVASGQTKSFSANPNGIPQWLDHDRLLWLREEANGNTSFVIGDASHVSRPYVAGVAPGPVSNLKLTRLSRDRFGFAVSGKSNYDGTLHNPSNAVKPASSGRIYTSLFVRHWDEYTQDEKNTIWVGTLYKPSVNTSGSSSEYKHSELTNLFRLFNIPNVESPILPFGGTDHFDICPRGVVFVAKDPTLNDATHTKCVCYYCPMPSWTDSSGPLQAGIISTGEFNGALSSPVLSPVNHTLAFLAMKEDGYESDKNRILVVPGLFDGYLEATEMFSGDEGSGTWDRSPSSLTWAYDDRSLIIKAEDAGRGIAFEVPMDDFRTVTTSSLDRLNTTGYVSSAVSTPSGVFLSSSSLVESSLYYLVVSVGLTEKVISSSSRDVSSLGLSSSQIDEIWCNGAEGHPVHAWIVKPSNFEPSKKYPLCFLVHGGPQGAWNDQWSTRWNPAIFAEQGYVVVAPNPTGSTGYGQNFTDAIQGSWGGRPYEDLVKCFEYIQNRLYYVDTNNAVALGASYGGFMMNWIQGHELGRKFKALVTHDGIFSTKFALATDELYFPIRDLKGIYWESRDTWQRWDPSEFITEWNTPHLVIHNTRDYRLSIAEGLATFNALQLRGVESAFLTFPDENHWVIKPENSLVWHRAVINWINKYADLPLWVDKDGNDGFPEK